MTRLLYWPGGRKLHLFCGIKGLIRDGDKLRDELLRIKPGKIYISISPEEIEGLKKFLEAPFQINMSDYEVLYGVALSRHGEVMTPPPIFIEPVVYANKFSVPVVGLDYSESEYSRIYAETVKPKDLMMHSLRKRSIGRKRFPQETPEEFVKEWDTLMTKNPRFRKIEEMRTRNMIDNFIEDFRKDSTSESILIMEFEKCEPCVSQLKENGFTTELAGDP